MRDKTVTKKWTFSKEDSEITEGDKMIITGQAHSDEGVGGGRKR